MANVVMLIYDHVCKGYKEVILVKKNVFRILGVVFGVVAIIGNSIDNRMMYNITIIGMIISFIIYTLLDRK